MTHHLKTWPSHFNDLMGKEKTVELRKNDRKYQQGDTLVLWEWDTNTKQYSGFFIRGIVTHMVRSHESCGALVDGYVALSLKEVTRFFQNDVAARGNQANR